MTDHDATPGGPAYPQDGLPRADTPQAGSGQPTQGLPQGPYPYPGAGYGGYGHPGYGQGGYGQDGWPPPGYGAPGYPEERPPRSGRAHGKIVAGVAVLGLVAGAGGTALATGVIHTPSSSTGALSTSAIVSQADPAVVDIVSRLGNQGVAAAGTGIVLTSDGTILTNNHVIDGATSISVTDVGNGRTYSATVTGYDASRDIAVVQLRNASGLTTARIGDSSTVQVSDKVVAVGNAGGRGGLPSVATGKVTGLSSSVTAFDEGDGSSERLTGVLQTNANIQPGDSGGPLLNGNGEVIGINTAAGKSGTTTSAAVTTKAFAVPINRAMSIAKQIESRASSATVHIGATAFLGVGISPPQQGFGGSGNGSGGGATVAGTVAGGAASRAGITAGDEITSLGGHPVRSGTDIRNTLITHHPGDKVSVSWVNTSGQQHTVTVTLGSGPPA